MTERILSIVLPARNEAHSLQRLLPELRRLHPDAEILVVDDGSSDDTCAVSETAGARVISHPYAKGNGAAIKTGARRARGDRLVFMDADGQHDPADIERLIAEMESGFDLVIGARRRESQASRARRFANGFYNRIASLFVGRRIEDLTTGFRACRAERFREFLHLLPNGFSYPTTSTMAFFGPAIPSVSCPSSRAVATAG